MSTEINVLRTVVTISLLIFSAKILAGLCQRVKVPEVIGEIFAGIVFGPYALGGAFEIFGGPAVEFNVILEAFAEIGGIIILFAAGLEITFAEFRATGIPSLVIGGMGVVVPFFFGYFLAVNLGYSWQVAILIGATLTATSISVTIRVLEELGVMKTAEAKIMINSAVIDDVIGLAVLSIVVSIFAVGQIPTIPNIATLILRAFILWLALLIGAVYLLPRLINITNLSKSAGTVEAAATASCFGLSALAAALGLSSIVGAFAAGMAIAGTRAISGIREFIEKLRFVFGPLFFAYIGMQLDVGQILNISIPVFTAILIVAVAGKLIGCGLPAAIFLKDREKGLRIGLGMVSRGEVGFIVAGIGLTSQVLTQDSYAVLLTVIMVTTIIPPFLLRRSYMKSMVRKELRG